MKTIPIEKIQEIAKESLDRQSNIKLPSLEQISWAFPIEGIPKPDYIGKYSKGWLNIQDSNTLRQLMIYENLQKTLEELGNGKVSDHTFPKKNIEDLAYLSMDFYPGLPDTEKQKITNGHQFVRPNSYFWENLPEELTKSILRADCILRVGSNVSEWGFPEGSELRRNAFSEESSVRQYIEELAKANRVGREYLNKIAQSKGQKGRFPQLEEVENVSNWAPGQEFQLAMYNPNDLLIGSLISKDRDELCLDVKDYTVNTRGWRSMGSVCMPIEAMDIYARDKLLWEVQRPSDEGRSE